MTERKRKYDDIIHLPHPISKKHPQMSRHDRAAQFAPFAALTGHGDAIRETARMTEDLVELDDYEMLHLDQSLMEIRALQSKHPLLTITYFQPDAKKTGGSYKNVNGHLLKLKDFERKIILEDGLEINMNHILELDILEEEAGQGAE